jgi:membrane peptidoglycan carboxypeptidase
MQILNKIVFLVVVLSAIFYLAYAGKIQSRRAARLKNMYNQGAITLERYEKLKKDNTLLNAFFNPRTGSLEYK